MSSRDPARNRTSKTRNRVVLRGHCGFARFLARVFPSTVALSRISCDEKGVGHAQRFAQSASLDGPGGARAGVSVLLAGLASAAETDGQRSGASRSLSDRAMERRAVEAAIWGMPAVNYDLMLQQMLGKTGGKVNEVIYWGRPLDWKNQTLTPNPDALYFMAFFNTKDGPIVLDLPPGDNNGSFNGNIVTAWQVPLEDAGLLGYDKGKGGKYLVLPPGFAGKVPDGYTPLQSDTYGGFMLFRSDLVSHSDADVHRSIAYGSSLVYPLAQAGSRPLPSSPM